MLEVVPLLASHCIVFKLPRLTKQMQGEVPRYPTLSHDRRESLCKRVGRCFKRVPFLRID